MTLMLKQIFKMLNMQNNVILLFWEPLLILLLKNIYCLQLEDRRGADA